MAEIQMFDVYVSDCLKRWGSEFPIANSAGMAVGFGAGYPSRSTVYVAMQFAGRCPRSNVTPPTTLDAVAWLIELIVCQIGSYDPRMALVLRAAFCARGSWTDRMQAATSKLSRSERPLRLSKSVYYRTRDMGVEEVGEYLKIAGDA